MATSMDETTMDYLQSKQRVKIIGDPVAFLLEGKAAF